MRRPLTKMKIELRFSFWISGLRDEAVELASRPDLRFCNLAVVFLFLALRHGGGCGNPTRSSGWRAASGISWSSVSLPKTW